VAGGCSSDFKPSKIAPARVQCDAVEAVAWGVRGEKGAGGKEKKRHGLLQLDCRLGE